MMNRAEFDRLVEQAVRDLPREFQDHLENVAIHVEEWPDAQTLADEEIDDPADLLGYYRGVPLIDRNASVGYEAPDEIILYRQAIMASCVSQGEVHRTIRETLHHEIAHHFGFDDDDLEEMGVY